VKLKNSREYVYEERLVFNIRILEEKKRIDGSMKVLCKRCGHEFEWESCNIFVQPDGYTMNFTCRDCIKETRLYKKGKISLKS
jgi:ribosomal protein S27E